MSSLTRQALIVSGSRFLNQGLMVISPVILVRLLSIEEFGAYRAFLLYTTLVGNLAAFSLANSLLYFIGLQPQGAWGYVKRIVLSLAATSALAAIGFVVVNAVLPEPLMREHLWPCVLYVLLYVNVDFWEFLWLAQRNPTAVFAYTAGRLLLRITVVIAAATLTRSVDVIVWSLVVLEGVRVLASLYWWRRLAAGNDTEPLKVSWREQLEFCVPSGLAVFVTTLNSSLGGLVINQTLGEAALAQFVVGGYVLMIVYPFRNSISDVMLPEMASLAGQARNAWLPLWQRSIVLFAILLLPMSILLGRYAEIFITTVFSAKYRGAEVVFQMHCILLALSCFDVALALRAINRTRSLIMANFVCIAVNIGAMVVLVPAFGSGGAGAALVLSALVGLAYLLRVLAGLQGLRMGELLPARRLAQVLLAAGVATLVIVPSFWAERFGIPGAVTAAALFLLVFVSALKLLRVDEAAWLLHLVGSRLGVAPRTH
jgi:O-antigen/teichoic acid export membrane protein